MRHARALRGRILGVVLLGSSVCLAQGGADVVRRGLIGEASAAARAGDHARAIELATRAAAIRPTPSLRYFLAREHLSLGHAVEALALAGECAAGARSDASVRGHEELVARCEAVAAEAGRAVARLTVRVPSPAPEGLRLTVNGVPLAPPLFDVAVPVAAGAVEVAATAPGREAFRATLSLTAGAREELTLRLPELAPPPVAPPVRESPHEAPSLPAPPALRPRPAPSSMGVAPWIVGGAGVVGLALAGALGAVALDARADRDAACPSAASCDPAAAVHFDGTYRDAALGTNIALGVGGALLVGAATWWIVDRATRRPAARVAASPSGLTLRW